MAGGVRAPAREAYRWPTSFLPRAARRAEDTAGVAFMEEADGLVEDLKDLVEDQLDDAARAGKRENHLVEEDLHDAIGKFVWQRLRRRPMVLPVVIEV